MMNATDTPNRAAKDTLARLLATENISVQHQPVPTACFDVAARTLILPVWKDMDGDLYDMLVMHEVGHALFTPAGEGPLMDAINSIDASNPHRVKSYLNICEDPRIEMLMKKKFPGGRRQFAVAYRTLWERGFFGVTEADIATKGFGDRANLHFKVGFLFADGTIPFSDEEQAIIDAVEAATTWEQMVECARAMYDLAPKEAPESNDQPEQGDGEGDTGMPGMPGEGESGEGDDGSDEPSESGDGETGAGDDGEDIGESMDDDSDDGESAESTAGDGDSESGDDAPAGEEQGEAPSAGDDAGETIQEGGTEAGTQAPAAEAIETESNFDQALEDTADTSARTRLYGTMPKTINTENVILDYTTVHKAFSEGATFDRDRMTKIAKEFVNETRPTVNMMVKQFEALMAADVDRRTAIGKSGVIDPNRLHSYTITEDIFLRRESVSDGKNHGIVMFMDWSGSMQDVLGDVVKQVINLALFCQKVNIPFEVYSFTSNCYHSEGAGKRYYDLTDEERESIESKALANYETGDIHLGGGYSNRFQIHNWMSSRMNTRQFNAAVTNLMCFTVNRWDHRDPNHDAVQRIPHEFDLGSTPLNECLMAAQYIIPAFRKANDLQIVNTVILTDGDSSGRPSTIEGNEESTYGSDIFISGRKTKKSYEMGYNATDNLIKMLRDETGTRVIGMFLASGSNASMNRSIENQIARSGDDLDWSTIETRTSKATAEFKKNNGVQIDHRAYDEYYLLKGNTSVVDGNDLDGLDHNASITKIRNTFIKNGNSKQSSRTILSRLAGTIASELS